MKRKILAVTAVMTLAMGVLAGCGSKPTASTNGGAAADTIKIGANLELTGDVASYGTSARDGAKLAVEEINAAGGVLGKKLELVEADNASKNEESVRAAQKLLADKVVAIVGAATSGNSVAMVPVVTEKKVPFISPSGTAEKVTVDERSGKLNDFAFRACFIDPFQGTVGAKFAANDLKAKTAAIYIDSSNDYSKGLAKAFKDQFTKNGGQIVAEENYQKRDTDFKAILTSIKDKKPDVIYVPGYYEEVGKIIKQGREMGITVPFVGGDGWDSPELAKIAGNENLNNTFFTNHYAADDKTPEVQSFVQAFNKKYNKTPDGFAILGYDCVKLITEAIKNSNSTDGVKIKDALAGLKEYKAASGVITFDDKHNPVKSAVIIEMKDGKQTFKTKVNP